MVIVISEIHIIPQFFSAISECTQVHDYMHDSNAQTAKLWAYQWKILSMLKRNIYLKKLSKRPKQTIKLLFNSKNK